MTQPHRAPAEITIVVPTITGREHWLEQCLDSYRATTPSTEILVIKDEMTCGMAWQIGLEQATGEYVHFTADDITAHEGWWQAGIQVCDQGLLPAPMILNPDGSLQSCGYSHRMEEDGAVTHYTRIPLLRRDQAWAIKPMYLGHYYTDIYLSERARMNGIETVICHAYLFTHHFAQEGRLDHGNRLEHDRKHSQALLKSAYPRHR